MDIGTAKPSAAERSRVTHHLLDLIDPAESYSAARFCKEATDVIAKVRARGRIPLLVGGTMLYFKALREGLDALPSADPKIRAELDRAAREQGWPAMHAALAAVDPATAARLAPGDTQRIQRALEVWHISGHPLSSFFTRRTLEGPDTDQFFSIALEPSSRAQLHVRIAQRLQTMLDQGFVDEVAGLRARDDLHASLPSMRCVGYRQIWDYLEGRLNRTQMVDAAVAATRQLAKRQLTWLRALPERRVVDCLASDYLSLVERLVIPVLDSA
jgi:tRNA dimethylallyltransferase